MDSDNLKKTTKWLNSLFGDGTMHTDEKIAFLDLMIENAHIAGSCNANKKDLEDLDRLRHQLYIENILLSDD